MEGKHVLSGRAGENVNGGGRRGRGGGDAESILYNSKFAKYHGNTKSLKADDMTVKPSGRKRMQFVYCFVWTGCVYM